MRGDVEDEPVSLARCSKPRSGAHRDGRTPGHVDRVRGAATEAMRSARSLEIPEFDLVTLLPRWRDPASRKCSLRRISSGQAPLAAPVHPMQKTPSACDVLTAPVNAAGTLGPRAASRTGTMR
jgi:hypothetical protein